MTAALRQLMLQRQAAVDRAAEQVARERSRHVAISQALVAARRNHEQAQQTHTATMREAHLRSASFADLAHQDALVRASEADLSGLGEEVVHLERALLDVVEQLNKDLDALAAAQLALRAVERRLQDHDAAEAAQALARAADAQDDVTLRSWYDDQHE